MGLKLYNTLTRSKDDFEPIDRNRVRMYVCGPTVYDYAHIGNARPVIVFDVLYRLLRHVYGESHVTYVRNITDVDDKINARAVRDFPDLPPVEAIRGLTETTYAQFEKDVADLGCLTPSVTPRATEHIGGMITLIERLIEKGFAYAAEGHVLFHVPTMKDYGSLSRRSLDDMIAGARVDVAPYKRDPMDFVLWKPSSEAEPGWDSRWGRGRPGWHIECSAMAFAELIRPFGGGFDCDDPTANIFDIHGGGIDLVFPHHENEIAQSCCALGTPRMANVWMHNGFLQVEGEKMSKSLGNFLTIRELLDEWPGEVLRLNMLKTQYRQPIDFTVHGLAESEATLNTWWELIAEFTPFEIREAARSAAIVEDLSDDLNTPAALARLHEAYAGAAKDRTKALELAGGVALLGLIPAELRALADPAVKAPLDGMDLPLRGLLGALKAGRADRLLIAKGIDRAAIEVRIAARLDARKSKDFAESDRIRDELAALGIVLKDGKNKETGAIETTWEVKR